MNSKGIWMSLSQGFEDSPFFVEEDLNDQIESNGGNFEMTFREDAPEYNRVSKLEFNGPAHSKRILMIITQGYSQKPNVVIEYLNEQIKSHHGAFVMTFPKDTPKDMRPSQLTFRFD